MISRVGFRLFRGLSTPQIFSQRSAATCIGSARFGTKGPKLIQNEQILQTKHQSLLLVGVDGKPCGKFSPDECIQYRDEKHPGLNLILIDNPKQPVCRLATHTEVQKKTQPKPQPVKKKNALDVMKEMRFSEYISEHDLDMKVKKIRQFLEKGHKVRLMCMLKPRKRGRAEPDQTAEELISHVVNQVEDVGKMPDKGRLRGTNIYALILPTS